MISNVLRIHSTPTKLDITTVTPYIVASYVNSELNIQKTPAQLNINQKNIKCQIDSTRCLAEEGHKTIEQLTADYAQQGIEDAQNAAKEAAIEGQEILEAMPHEKVFQEIEKSKVFDNQAEYGLKFIPSQGPVISWEQNYINTDYQPAKQDFQWNTSIKPDTRLERTGSVNITVSQYPKLDIEYVGDISSGLDIWA